jgi:hypothetical protein
LFAEGTLKGQPADELPGVSPMSQSAHKSILPRDWKLGFQPDSAGELPACRAFVFIDRHAGSVSAESGKDAYPPDAITRSIFHVPAS